MTFNSWLRLESNNRFPYAKLLESSAILRVTRLLRSKVDLTDWVFYTYTILASAIKRGT